MSSFILLTSGYSGVEFFFSNKITAFLYLGLFFCSLILFFFSLPDIRSKVKNIKEFFKTKATIKNILVLLCFLLFFISCGINAFKNNNINGTFRFLIICFSSLFIIVSISFETFAKIYSKALLVICLISLPIYLVASSIGAEGAGQFTITDGGAIVNSYNFLSFFVNKWLTYHKGQSSLLRLSGPFWEPSIFAAIIVIGLLLISLTNIKRKAIYYAAYLISLVLTFSTGGYFVAILIIPLIISIRVKDVYKRTIYVAILLFVLFGGALLIMGPLLPYLAEAFPTLFSKFLQSTQNTRFLSIPYLINVFSKSPLFGFGINEARNQYVALFPDGTTDYSLTSTYGLFLAAFGIPGLLFVLLFVVSPFLLKNNNFLTNLLISIILLILLNLENMAMISVVILLLSFLVKDGLYGSDCCFEKTCSTTEKLHKALLNNGERGHAYKNMFGLLIIKGISMFVAIFIIPVYISFFKTNELYGTWSVIISVLSWTLLLDFGFGSGLRAKLADAIDNNDDELKKKLISSTYFGSLAASIIIFIIFEILIMTLDLNSFMGIPQSVVEPNIIKTSMTILAFGLCLEFVLKNIIFIYYAEKKTILGASFALVSNLLLLLFFSVFRDSFASSKLIAASIIYLLCANLPFLIGSLVYFAKKNNRIYAPRLKCFNISTCKSVMSFGVVFFLIQIGFMLISQTDSLFISNVFGPSDAADYSKYYRIFSFFIGLMAAVVQQPIWSAIASSVNKGKYEDIKKFTAITVGISFSLFVMCVLSGLALQFIFDIWLGENTISVDRTIVLCFICFSFVYLVADAFIIVSNSLKILKIQALVTMIDGVLKIVSIIIIKNYINSLSFNWSIFLIIDSICYLPLIILLPFAILKKIKLLKAQRNLS